MKIIDLQDEYKQLYCECLEDWSDDIKEAGDHKLRWCERMKDKGLRVKLALDDNGQVGGMIQYVPIEYSSAEGEGLYFVNCIWVHGHKKGRGNFQKKGMGKALLRSAEDDVKSMNVNGMVAWGLILPFFMRSSWFKKHGYKRVDRDGIMELVWKPLAADAKPPKWIRKRKKPQLEPGKVTVTALLNGWCPAQNMAYERAKRACGEFGDSVVFRPIDAFDRNVFLEWGQSDALFIDKKQVRTGPPPSYEKIRRLIEKKAKRVSGRA
ncbi:MAG: GNAT family N-acetyltransferase [Candidatus Eisenbacteria bacterium]|nr:GNAT family N-acetyltransferase [Candidatus Eisenbacteria bacterium]